MPRFLTLALAASLSSFACSKDESVTTGLDDASTEPVLLPDGAPNPLLPDGAPRPDSSGIDSGITDSAPPDTAVADSGQPDVGAPDSGAPDSGGPGTPGVIGNTGIAAWDALPAAEKNKVKVFRTTFQHQSVGQDLEDGCEDNGFPWEYFGPGQSTLRDGLNGGLFAASNGNPGAKIAEWQAAGLRVKSTLRVAMMKFGYADVTVAMLPAAEAAYLAATNTLKAQGLRVLHVTPPLVFDTSQNPPKMQMRTWMLATFTGDVIYDFQDIESTDATTGARCEVGGVWHICQNVRSRSGCASKGQGIDGPGQGHLCAAQAQRISKAMLYAIYQAGI